MPNLPLDLVLHLAIYVEACDRAPFVVLESQARADPIDEDWEGHEPTSNKTVVRVRM